MTCSIGFRVREFWDASPTLGMSNSSFNEVCCSDCSVRHGDNPECRSQMLYGSDKHLVWYSSLRLSEHVQDNQLALACATNVVSACIMI